MNGELEAAHKRGMEAVGNAADWRDALEAAKYCLVNRHTCSGYTIEDTIAKIDAVLAAPALNCEVGTWQQQEKRFENFCNRFRHDYCRGCSLGEEFFENHEIGECRLAWAQKPYSGEVTDGK